VDGTDSSLVDAAIRETVEEIGVKPKQIQILGRMLPVVKSLHGLDVHCFVGYIHSSDYKGNPAPAHMTDDLDKVLPSLSMSSLTRSIGEVSQIFHLPLSYLVDMNRLRQHNLPNRPPYHAIDVTDLIDQAKDTLLPPTLSGTGDEVGRGDSTVPNVEVWGLTGWHLNQLMRRLDAY